MDTNSDKPIYIQLANTLREKIATGEIKIGDKLISETEMIKEYNIGRLTIREALSVLVNEGLLKKHHGKGTFCIATPQSKKQYNFDVLLDMGDVYFTPYYLRSICGIFEKENCNVVVSDTRNNIVTICELLTKIIRNGSDGVIIQPNNNTSEGYAQLISLFSLLEENEIPYILLDGIYKNVTQSYVVLNEYKAGELAAGHFTELGHKNLCMITNNTHADSIERQKGFEDKLTIKPHIISFDSDFQNKLTALLKAHPEITGIFCYNDLVALECYNALSSCGYVIPDDISVISMDDTILASALTPSITSVSHPKNRLGKAAAQALLDIKNCQQKWPYKKIFESSIIKRNSVKSFTR